MSTEPEVVAVKDPLVLTKAVPFDRYVFNANDPAPPAISMTVTSNNVHWFQFHNQNEMLGLALQAQLRLMPETKLAVYRCPSPLEHRLVLKLVLHPQRQPLDARDHLRNALQLLRTKNEALRVAFNDAKLRHAT